MVNPIIYRLSTIPGGAGFRNHPLYHLKYPWNIYETNQEVETNWSFRIDQLNSLTAASWKMISCMMRTLTRRRRRLVMVCHDFDVGILKIHILRQPPYGFLKILFLMGKVGKYLLYKSDPEDLPLLKWLIPKSPWLFQHSGLYGGLS